ncbi:hypothetical protein [Rhodovulum visakhapatnamense]|uniref:hypothetical protein n=1 Tax=Rhodovulum visakhapatnamense TaxID=364297 RepID=UPI001F3AB50C|nr:hypothetical protein [Rhodovulum visakhapatnamense]
MTQDKARPRGRKRAMRRFAAFASDRSGAVTVDWVVLTAALVGACIAMVSSIQSGLVSLGGDVGGALTSANVQTLDTLGGTE